MTVGRVVAIAAVALVLASPAFAGEQHPTLAELETEVMCPTCHTTLDQSSSPVADRIRAFIRVRIAAGDTKSEIKTRLVDQFGEQILASPSTNGFNLLAWVLPPVAVIVGGGVVALLAVRWSRRRDDGASGRTVPSDPAVERRIDDELARLDA